MQKINNDKLISAAHKRAVNKFNLDIKHFEWIKSETIIVSKIRNTNETLTTFKSTTGYHHIVKEISQ
jgi:hypothetical protein